MQALAVLLSTSLFLASCGFSGGVIAPDQITSINIIDRNGLSETISTKERLCTYEKTDFLTPQPYQKVLRVFGTKKNGDVRSCITSYHPNGEVKQYLEAINNRAHGPYAEWHPNGQRKIEATVIGGMADLNTTAEKSWLFEGVNRAWNSEGKLIAEIPYHKGVLEGEALYYHDNGKIWKRADYQGGLLSGTQEIYLEDGSLFQTTTYVAGKKEGTATRYWPSGQIAYEELYCDGRLEQGRYLDISGTLVSTVEKGRGERALFGKEALHELHTYKNGEQEGEVRIFDDQGQLIRLYTCKSGLKQGAEIDYFPGTSQRKLQLTWDKGILQGTMKTWYPDGTLESQREMSQNKKNGLLTAWYKNGALMLVEEYESDKLVKGEYFRPGDKAPTSKIENGEGIATLFTPEGIFSQKVTYAHGKPAE